MDRVSLEKEVTKIIELIKNKSYKEALEHLNNILLEKNIKNPKILNLYGIVQLHLNQLNEAANSFENAIKLDPNFIQAYNNLGNLYVKSGEFLKAIEMYNKVLVLKPDYPEGYNNLASAQNDLGRLEDSIKNYVNALNFDPNFISAKNNIIQVLTFHNPKNLDDNIFTKSNSDLQSIDIPYKEHNEISDEEVILFYKKCKEISDKNFKNFNFQLSQIWRSNTINLGCNRHFDIFNNFKVIPEYCFGCFKVQVELYSVLDLIKLYFVFDKLSLNENNSRKCMIELREVVGGSYKGLIYCSSIDEANNILKDLKNILDKKINKKIKIVVKRGCTEFAIEHPKYKIIDIESEDFMNYNEIWKEKESIIDNNTYKYLRENSVKRKPTIKGVTLNDVLIIKNWIYYAKKIGDLDYKKLDNDIFISDHIEQETSRQLEFRRKEYQNSLY